MQRIEDGYRGMRLLMNLNWDRLLWPTAITIGLMIGSYAVPV